MRLELVDHICQLGASLKVKMKIIKNYEVYIKNIEPLFLIYLSDRATGVRNAGIKAVPQFVKAFGETWVNSFIPKLEDVLTK